MNKQPSKSRGILYVVSTPIGNLEDLTFRALKVLGEVDCIACEDTRHTIKLLNRYNIKKKLISYYQPRENQKIPVIIKLLLDGKNIALVTNAGTPGISDPGFRLVREAVKEGIQVVPIPGASAVISALAASGLPTHKFVFSGFPSPKKERIKKMLHSLKEEEGTLVFYLPLRKISDFLEYILEIMGDREVVIAREMTKVHEEFIRGSVKSLIQILKEKSLRGEATILVRGTD